MVSNCETRHTLIVDSIACLNSIFLKRVTFRSSTDFRWNRVITKYYVVVFAAVNYCYEVMFNF